MSGNEEIGKEMDKMWKSIESLRTDLRDGLNELKIVIRGNEQFDQQGIIHSVRYNKKNVDNLRQDVDNNTAKIKHNEDCIEDIESWENEINEKVDSNTAISNKSAGVVSAIAFIISIATLIIMIYGV